MSGPGLLCLSRNQQLPLVDGCQLSEWLGRGSIAENSKSACLRFCVISAQPPQDREEMDSRVGIVGPPVEPVKPIRGPLLCHPENNINTPFFIRMQRQTGVGRDMGAETERWVHKLTGFIAENDRDAIFVQGNTSDKSYIYYMGHSLRPAFFRASNFHLR
jgi:hypothetical protein